MGNLYRFFNSNAFSVVVLAAAIILKIGMRRVFLLFGSDKLGQVVITKNFLSGHGITIDTVRLDDLSHRLYQFSPDWPIGYNVLLSPFWLLTNGDFTLAIFLIDCLTAVMLTWYLRKLLIDIGFSSWLANLVLLFQAVFISHPLMSSHTDFVSTAFLLAAVYHLQKFLTGGAANNHKIVYGSLFLVATGLIRYQYIPVVLLLLIFIWIINFQSRKRGPANKILIALLALASFFSLFLVYQYSQTVNTFFLSKMRSGFYPANISYLYPFVPGSFINLELLAVQASRIFNTSYSFWIDLSKWINQPLVLLLSFVLVRFIWKRRMATPTAGETFIILGGACSLFILGELIFLSITKDKNIGPPLFEWTFVSTGRYFAWVILFTLIGTAWWLFCEPAKSFLKSIIRVIFILAVSIHVMHGLYYVSKQFRGNLVPMDKIVYQNHALNPVIGFIEQMKKNDPGRAVIVAAFDKQYGFIANLHGASGFFSPQMLNETLPKSSGKAVMLAVLARDELFYMSKFLQAPGVKLYHQSKGFFYFTYFVDPHATPGN